MCIRVLRVLLVVVNWVNDKGGVYPIQPKVSEDYNIKWGSDWFLASDGFYYYGNVLDIGGVSSNLLDSVSLTETCNKPNGYSLVVDVLFSSVQSNPTWIVEDVWKIVKYTGNPLVEKE